MPTSKSAVENVYLTLRTMCIDFKIKPSMRINESQLSKSLAASRTPLREALNRLQTDGFVTHSNGDGFFGRCLDAQTMENLLHMRFGLTQIAIKIGAGDAGFDFRGELAAFWHDISDAYYVGADPECLIAYEDQFDAFLVSSIENSVCANMVMVCADQTRFIRKAMLQTNPALVPAIYQNMLCENGKIVNLQDPPNKQFLNDALKMAHAEIHMEGGR